jgi:hypothetical protein
VSTRYFSLFFSFSSDTFSLDEISTSQNDFHFFSIFVELFVLVIDSPVMNTLGIHDTTEVNTLGNMNVKNSLNIENILKSLLGMSNGTRRSCLVEKTRVKKTSDTVPLQVLSG